jgi:hypothetical protein
MWIVFVGVYERPRGGGTAHRIILFSFARKRKIARGAVARESVALLESTA